MKFRLFSLQATALLVSTFAWAEGTGVHIDVTLTPAGSFVAETQSVTGQAYKTPDGFAAENIVVDVTTLKTGVSLRDTHTQKYLLADQFPQAKLIKASGKDGKGTATVEIKGIKKEVYGTYKVDGKVLKATFPIVLSELDIKGIRYMGVGVKDQVVVNVDIPISPAPQMTK